MIPQDWHFAKQMLNAAYVDMPYLCLVPGALVATVTYSTQPEGGDQQHVCVIRSTDSGYTWGAPIDLEAASDPESSWAMPWYDWANAKLYVFYIYNFEDVRTIPTGIIRVDCIGKIAYKVSTDGGLTWSARTLIDLGAKDIDNRNPFAGTKQLLWLSGHVVEHAGQIYLGFSKMGTPAVANLFADTEAFIMRADYGASGLSNFTQLPDTGIGIKLPIPFWMGGPAMTITEEPSLIVHDDGLITVVTRTDRGRLGESFSTDGGATFTNDWARQHDGYYTIYHPRGPAAIHKLHDGRFILWTYNTNSPDFNGRNPVWYRIGYRVGNRIRWGDADALAFYQDPATRIGYPTFLQLRNEILVSASNKSSGRLMRFPLSHV